MASQTASDMLRFSSVYAVLCQYVALVVRPSPAKTYEPCDMREVGSEYLLYSEGQRCI
jgi:hypothetical protein